LSKDSSIAIDAERPAGFAFVIAQFGSKVSVVDF